MAVFVALILWFDNAQGITSNGVFKAVTIKAWVSDPANASLETSNYLYYPAMPLFYRLLMGHAPITRGFVDRLLDTVIPASA